MNFKSRTVDFRGSRGYPPGEHAHLMPSGTNGVSIAHCQWGVGHRRSKESNVRAQYAGAVACILCRLKFA